MLPKGYFLQLRDKKKNNWKMAINRVFLSSELRWTFTKLFSRHSSASSGRVSLKFHLDRWQVNFFLGSESHFINYTLPVIYHPQHTASEHLKKKKKKNCWHLVHTFLELSGFWNLFYKKNKNRDLWASKFPLKFPHSVHEMTAASAATDPLHHLLLLLSVFYF